MFVYQNLLTKELHGCNLVKNRVDSIIKDDPVNLVLMRNVLYKQKLELNS